MLPSHIPRKSATNQRRRLTLANELLADAAEQPATPDPNSLKSEKKSSCWLAPCGCAASCWHAFEATEAGSHATRRALSNQQEGHFVGSFRGPSHSHLVAGKCSSEHQWDVRGGALEEGLQGEGRDLGWRSRRGLAGMQRYPHCRGHPAQA